MKKTALLLFLVALISAQVISQDVTDTTKLWKFSGIGSITLNQASFSNWSPGGENSYSGAALLKLFANYKKNNFTLDNSATLKYGLLKLESESMRKNEDLIDLNSVASNKFSKNWGFSGLINFNTQFDDGYNYPDDSTVISKFMSPAYLTVAPGLIYKPVDYFSIMITPITAKWIFVMDQDLADIGAYGVDKAKYDTLSGVIVKTDGKNVKTKAGAFVEFYLKKNLKEDLGVESKLNLFYNYLNDNNIPEGKMPLDFNWQTYFIYKINNWFSASFFAHLAYMPGDVFITRSGINNETVETKPNLKLQIKETFGIGLAYTFSK